MIERLYPGVYVTELPCEFHPIDGVAQPPDWTQANQHDPGVSLVQLFASLAENLLYRSSPIPDAQQPRGGVAQGLAVAGSEALNASSVSISPGLALSPQGRIVDTVPQTWPPTAT